MLRNSPSGPLVGLAKLLADSGNDAGGIEILNLGAPTTPDSAARLSDVTGAVVGPIAQYTVGPAWTNARFSTWAAAIAQAVADGHSTATAGSEILLLGYPGRYTENVVIPETLPRFVIRGFGAGDQGTVINGSLTINAPGANATAALNDIEVTGATTYAQAAPSATSTSFAVQGCTLTGAVNVNSSATLGVAMQFIQTIMNNVFNATARSFRAWGVQFGNAGCTVTCDGGSIVEFCQLSNLLSTTGVYSFTSVVRSRLYFCAISGRVVFGGALCVMEHCRLEYDGSPAVTDNCTAASFNFGNTFVHNAGAAGPAWVKTGASVYHDGGNSYTEGQDFPFASLGSGTRSDRAEGDNEQRRVIEVSGSPVLTAAQIGSQRRTTIAKTDGGGSVTLPPVASLEPGATHVHKNLSGATASPYNIVPNGAETIDGAASYSIDTDLQAVELQAHTGGWLVLNAYL